MSRIRWGDGVIILVVLLLSLGLFLFSLLHTGAQEAGESLTVTAEAGEAVYLLSQDRIITLTSAGYTLCIEIRDGAAAVIRSDCPDKVCLYHGTIDSAGDTVICVPAGVVLRITGEEDPDADEDIIAG